MAHITGGGLSENVPRMLPDGCAAEIDPRAWSIPPIFRVIEERGGIARAEMFRAFNMGIGMVVASGASDAGRVLELAAAAGERNAVRLGRVVSGERGVWYM
jgi:phosphoribosylformylglycinamidine cyclo-ligase